MKALAASEEALQRGDVEGSARALLAAWRELPHADLAEALDRFPARAGAPLEGTPTERMNAWLQAFARAGPLDVPALLDALEAMLGSVQPRFVRPCLDALAVAAADPRVGARLMKLAPSPERSLNGPFNAALWRHAGARELDRLKELVAQTGNGKFKQIRFTVEKKASKLVLEHALRVRVLELGLKASKRAAPEAAEQGADALLERVRAAPDDLACREVFRDWLLERGDSWGELIALQEHRARSGGEETPRERALLRQLRPRMLGSLAGAKSSVLSELQFERGFLVGATVKRKGVMRVGALLSRPELSTLERVTFLQDSTLTPNLKALREAHGLRPESLAAAVKRTPELKLEVLSASCGPEHLQDLLLWPTLRELHLMGSRASSFLRALQHLAVVKQLRAVGLSQAWAQDAFYDWSWEALDVLPIQRFELAIVGGPVFELARASDGWDVTVAGQRGTAQLPLDAKTVELMKAVLRESRSVTFGPGAPADLLTEPAAGPRER